MKILHVLDHSLPIHSGYTFRSLNILQEQQALGWKPFVVTSPKHEMFQQESVLGEEKIAGLKQYRTLSYVRSRIPIVAEFLLVVALRKRLIEVIEKERPDLIHAHSPVLNVLAALSAGATRRIPVVYEVRAFWEDAAVDHGTYREGSWKYRMVRFSETFACNKADQVVVLSSGLRGELIRRGVAEDKITIVPNAVDAEHFRANGSDETLKNRWGLGNKRVIGFIGSFYRYEGLDLLVDAVARLSQRWPDLKLLLAGGGEIEGELNSQVEKLGLRDKVVVTGRIPHDEVPRIYGLTDILAYPRRSMRLTELVTPLKPLEAMAMGKAVVGSDVGGHRELIQNEINGVLFQADNSIALAEELNRLLMNDALRIKLGTNASSWVRNERSWKHVVAKHATIYQRALGREVPLS